MSTRQYARLVHEWVVGIDLQPQDYGTHSLRRRKASLIYKATGNLRAVQILLGTLRPHERSADMSSIIPPPGLVGDIAQSIYAMAPRPVPELAIAAAIGLMSGVCGRSFNVSGTGLNNFVLALAPTGRGKEAINSGISRIIDTIANPADGTACVPLATTFYGSSDAASGQGLARELAAREFPCFVSITGEFGHRFGQMADDRATDANKSLRRLMLDSYNKSGHGQRLGQTVTATRARTYPPCYRRLSRLSARVRGQRSTPLSMKPRSKTAFFRASPSLNTMVRVHRAT